MRTLIAREHACDPVWLDSMHMLRAVLKYKRFSFVVHKLAQNYLGRKLPKATAQLTGHTAALLFPVVVDLRLSGLSICDTLGCYF